MSFFADRTPPGLDASDLVVESKEERQKGHRFERWIWTRYDYLQTEQGDNIYRCSWEGTAWVTPEEVAQYFGDFNSPQVREAVFDWIERTVEGLNAQPAVRRWADLCSNRKLHESFQQDLAA